MPAGTVIASDGRMRSLADLHRSGIRNFYFYRDDCRACQLLQPELGRMPQDVRARTAFVHFSNRRQMQPPDEPNHFAWVPDSAAVSFVKMVPAFFAVNDAQRVISAADFEVLDVVSVMDLYRILDGGRTIQALRNAAATDSTALNSLPGTAQPGDVMRAPTDSNSSGEG